MFIDLDSVGSRVHINDFQPKVRDDRVTAARDEQPCRRQHRTVGEVRFAMVTASRQTCDRVIEPGCDAIGYEHFGEHRCDRHVLLWQKMRTSFDDRDRRAKARIDLRKLAADRRPANDDQGPGLLIRAECVLARPVCGAFNPHDRRNGGSGASIDDEVVVSEVRIAHLHDAGCSDAASPTDESSAQFGDALRGFCIITVVRESVAPRCSLAVYRNIVS